MVQEFKPDIGRPTGGESPLKEFVGVLDKYVPEERTAQRDQSKYMVIGFNFTDVEVIQTDEPWPFPIVILKLGYKPPKDSRGGSKWDAFSSSLRKLEIPDLDALVGKKQRWAQLPHKIRTILMNEDGSQQQDGNGQPIWGEQDMLCWKVVEVEGVGSVEETRADFYAFLVDMADGKTEPKFYEAALTNSRVTSDEETVGRLTGRTLLPTLEEMKLLTRDAEGILHKVVTDVPVAEATT